MTIVKINAISVPADSGDELADNRFAARAGAVLHPRHLARVHGIVGQRALFEEILDLPSINCVFDRLRQLGGKRAPRQIRDRCGLGRADL